VDDGHGGTDDATVTITITGVNDDPVAMANEFTADEDAASTTGVTDDLLANDDDPDGDTLTLTEINGTVVTDGEEIELTYGTLTIHADGTFRYVFDKAAHNLSVGDDPDQVESFGYTVG